ncbi:MAG TPA: hypothetical protein VJ324_08120 [Candidatus Acidoferrum sp.]|nr:hypothetical protein [Candidatus Acidoferrum sp.]
MQPVTPVGDGGAEKVDHGDVPEAPEEAEENRGAQRRESNAYFGEGKTGPADFFEEAGGDSEGHA